MQNFIVKGLNGQFKIVAATQYITRIKDSTKKVGGGSALVNCLYCGKFYNLFHKHKERI